MTQPALVTGASSALPIGYRKKIARDEAPAEKHAAGVICVAPDGSVLLLHRSSGEANYAGHWGWPGGGAEDGEQPEDTARRETREETGADISDESPMKPIDLRRSPTGIDFYTFATPVKEKFAPTLADGEHSGFTWANLQHLPGPLHPAVAATLQDQVGIGADMKPEDLAGARDGFMKWLADQEPEHAHDSALVLALDRAPENRVKDRDGRLKIMRTHLTKACVSEYRGEEIPKWKELGLEPQKIYRLLRDPEEIKKGAHTINGVPLLEIHKPVSAKAPAREIVVGSVGSTPEFDGEYLDNALFVNDGTAVDGIESERKRELSAGYHYTADMTPGIFRGNEPFDGVMRDIEFNHVALVEDGRAGPDVLAADSKEGLMAKATRFGALVLKLTAAQLAPCLAMDAKLTLPKDAFSALTTKNFKTERPKLLETVRIAMDGKLRPGLAYDETLLAKLLEEVEAGGTEGADESVSPEQEKAMEAAAHGTSNIGIPEKVGKEFAKADEGKKAFDAAPLANWLKEKKGVEMSEDEMTEFSGMFPQPAVDEKPEETPEEKAAREKAEKDKQAADEEKDKAMKDMVTKPAMDAAIDIAVKATEKRMRETEQGIRSAIADVRPYVGELSPTLAFDSAASVHRHALKMLKVDGSEKLHVDALLPVLKAQRIPGSKPTPTVPAKIAMDEKAKTSLAKLAPWTSNIRTG